MFWKKRKPVAESPSPLVAPPQTIDLIPGKVALQVSQQNLPVLGGTVPCRTFRSVGLQRLKQPEISLTFLLTQDELDPVPTLHYFSLLHQLASQERIVYAGQWTEFGEKKFYDRHLVYIPAQRNGVFPADSESLMAISVTDRELAEVKRFGILRLMARLGQQARYYPFPFWLDPKRPETGGAPDAAESILAQIRCLPSPHVRVLKKGGTLELRILPRTRAYLAEALRQIDETEPVAFLTTLDDKADGCLVWEPGQSDPVAISPPTSKGEYLCGCFIAFVPVEEPAASFHLIEDGFVLKLSPADWRSVRQAILTGKSAQVAGGKGNILLQLNWD
jgi:hypothetical protein